MTTAVVTIGYDHTQVAGKIDIDLKAASEALGEAPEHLAIVPEFNRETGEIYNWSVIPLVSVLRGGVTE